MTERFATSEEELNSFETARSPAAVNHSLTLLSEEHYVDHTYGPVNIQKDNVAGSDGVAGVFGSTTKRYDIVLITCLKLQILIFVDRMLIEALIEWGWHRFVNDRVLAARPSFPQTARGVKTCPMIELLQSYLCRIAIPKSQGLHYNPN